MIFGFGPFGDAPFGDAGGAVDLSVANPLDALLRDPLLRRTYLFYSLPYDPGSDSLLPVKLSSDGFASDVDDTLPDGSTFEHALFRAALITPYNVQNHVMSGGQLSDDPVPSRGDLVFENASGRFRSYLGLEWDSAYAQILLGRPEWQLQEFASIFTGVTGPIQSADVMEVHVPLLDNSYKLRRDIQLDSYRGFGACIRGNGTTGFASGSVSCPAGDMSLECVFRPTGLSAAAKAIAGWKGAAEGAGQRTLRQGSAVAGRMQWKAINDAGTVFEFSVDGLLTVGRATYFAYVLDVTAGFLYGYAEVDRVLVPVGSVAISGTFNTTLTAFALLREGTASANFCDGDIDEVRVSDSALSESELEARMVREILSSTTGLTHRWDLNEGTGATGFDSTGSADLTLTSTTWVGSLEGGSDLAGEPPPIWEGINPEVEPVNVDSQNYVYEVSRNPTAVTVSDVKDKGALSYTMDSPVSDIYIWTPVAGHCVTAYMDGRMLLRLEAAPQGRLTCTVTSDTTDSAGIVKKFAKSYGGFVDAGIDLVAFAQVSAAYPQDIGIGLRLQNAEIWDLMQEVARKAGGWVTMTRAGLLTITILTAPSMPRFELTENDIQANGVQRISQTLAVKKTRLGYKRYSTTQQPNDLATSLTEAEKNDLGKEYRFAESPVDRTVTAIRSNALVREEQTLYYLEADAYDEAVRRQVLWGVNRVTFLLPLTRGLFQYAIGDVVSVTVQAADGTYIEALNGTLLVVVGYVEDPRLDTIQLHAWGEDPLARRGALLIEEGGGGLLIEEGGGEILL